MARRPTTIRIHGSVYRIGQHLIDHFITWSTPGDQRSKTSSADLMRELHTLPIQAQQHAPHGTQLAEQMHDLLDRVPHRLVGAELKLTGELVVGVADGTGFAYSPRRALFSRPRCIRAVIW